MDAKVIAVKSALGLTNQGAARLAETLLSSGLMDGLKHEVSWVEAPAPSGYMDPKSNVLNAPELFELSMHLGSAVEHAARGSKFSLVLGGDCSILIGIMLGLKRVGRYGLCFLDGHSDFYTPKTSASGEAADMDLAIVCGRGPELLCNLEGRAPYVDEPCVAAFGFRDIDEYLANGAEDIRATRINCYPLDVIRACGLAASAREAAGRIKKAADKFWVHLDVDVLSPQAMPAVDYRLSGGLEYDELALALQEFLPGAAGLSVSIYNPELDPNGSCGKHLAGLINQAIKCG